MTYFHRFFWTIPGVLDPGIEEKEQIKVQGLDLENLPIS